MILNHGISSLNSGVMSFYLEKKVEVRTHNTTKFLKLFGQYESNVFQERRTEINDVTTSM